MSTLIVVAMLLIPTVRVHTYVSHPEANPVMVCGKCIIETIRAMPALVEPNPRPTDYKSVPLPTELRCRVRIARRNILTKFVF